MRMRINGRGDAVQKKAEDGKGGSSGLQRTGCNRALCRARLSPNHARPGVHSAGRSTWTWILMLVTDAWSQKVSAVINGACCEHEQEQEQQLDSPPPSPRCLTSMHRQHTTARPSTHPPTSPPNYNPKARLRVMNADREPSCRSQPMSTPARCDDQRNAALIPGRQSTRRCAGHRVQACESCRQRCTGRRP
jgi:hypothetical protein